MADSVVLCQLLNSYLCHEISGPISAINNCIELINSPNSDIKNNATTLIKDAANELAIKVKLYSYLYSTSEPNEVVSFDVIKELCANFCNGNITLDFSNASSSEILEPELSKAIICLIIISCKSLLKGGVVRVIYQQFNDTTRIIIKSIGENLYINSDNISLLSGKNSNTQLTIHNCNEYYLNTLNNKMGYKLAITHLSNTIEYCYII